MAPTRPACIVTLDRTEAEHKFHPEHIYTSRSAWTTPIHINVLSRTSDHSILIKVAEGAALDATTLTSLAQSPITKVSLFTDKDNAEYTYVLARRISAMP